MNRNLPVSSGCGCCTSRRRFLAAGCGLCAASAVPGLFAGLAGAADEPRASAVKAGAGRARVRLVFACFTLKQDRPTWPHIGYDFAPDIDRVTSALRRLCPAGGVPPGRGPWPRGRQEASGRGPVGPHRRLSRLPDEQLGAGDADRRRLRASRRWWPILTLPAAAGSSSTRPGFAARTRTFRSSPPRRSKTLPRRRSCFEVLAKGGSTAEFVAACDRVRRERTPARRSFALPRTIRSRSPAWPSAWRR